MTLPTEYWTLGSCGRLSHPEPHRPPVGPWALCYRTGTAALDAARAVLAAAEGPVLALSGHSAPPYGPGADSLRVFGPHRLEWRPIPGSREVCGPDEYHAASVWICELYEVRVVRDVVDVEIRTLDGKDFECRTPRVEVLVDWTADLRPPVGKGALWAKGPWRAELYTTAHRHALPWADESKETAK